MGVWNYTYGFWDGKHSGYKAMSTVKDSICDPGIKCSVCSKKLNSFQSYMTQSGKENLSCFVEDIIGDFQTDKIVSPSLEREVIGPQ